MSDEGEKNNKFWSAYFKTLIWFWVGWIFVVIVHRPWIGVSNWIVLGTIFLYTSEATKEDVIEGWNEFKDAVGENKYKIYAVIIGIFILWAYFQNPHPPSLTTVGMFVLGLFSVPFALYFKDREREIFYFFSIIAVVGLVFAPVMKGSGYPTFIKEPKRAKPIEEPEKGAYTQVKVVGTSGRREAIENADLWVSFDEPRRGVAGVQNLQGETNSKGLSTIYADVVPGRKATIYADKEGYYSEPKRGVFTYLSDVEDSRSIIELSEIAKPNMNIRKEVGLGENFGLRRENMKVYGDFHSGTKFKIEIGGIGFGESFNDPILEIETEEGTQVDIHSLSEEGNIEGLKVGHIKCSRERNYEITFRGNMDVGDKIQIPLLLRSSVDSGETVLKFELNDLHGVTNGAVRIRDPIL